MAEFPHLQSFRSAEAGVLEKGCRNADLPDRTSARLEEINEKRGDNRRSMWILWLYIWSPLACSFPRMWRSISPWLQLHAHGRHWSFSATESSLNIISTETRVQSSFVNIRYELWATIENSCLRNPLDRAPVENYRGDEGSPPSAHRLSSRSVLTASTVSSETQLMWKRFVIFIEMHHLAICMHFPACIALKSSSMWKPMMEDGEKLPLFSP